ncbi:MAG: Ribonuclease VapC48 [bacterium]|nr:Ribonuclease VapC48 [bacterium]
MGGVIDTNILLYAANRQAAEHPNARDFITQAARSSEQWYLTSGLLYEFLRVSTHPRVFPQPLSAVQAVRFIQPFIRSSAFQVLSPGERHWDLLDEEVRRLGFPAGNLFFDIRTVVLMREHGLRVIYTADTDFLQFPGITVVDPVHQR